MSHKSNTTNPVSVRILHQNTDALRLLKTATKESRVRTSVLTEPNYCSRDANVPIVLLTSFEFAERFLPGHKFPVIVVDSNPSIERAVKSIKQGAFDYFNLSSDRKQIMGSLSVAIEQVSSAHTTSSQPELIGKHPKIRQVRRAIDSLADDDSHVLLSAPTGTETEVVARAIHRNSQRNLMGLIAVNCSLHDKKTLGQLLYGDDTTSTGVVEQARHSTLFLDQIPSLTDTQYIQFFSVATRHDVRVIAAIGPEHALQLDRTFRAHFSETVIELPALRDRTEDIGNLAEAFLERYAHTPLKFSPAATQTLMNYQWPSNTRELENIVERAVLLTKSAVIEPSALAIQSITAEPFRTSTAADHSLEEYFINFVKTHEQYLSETEIAARLGISRKSLWQRRQRHGMPRKFSKL